MTPITGDGWRPPETHDRGARGRNVPGTPLYIPRLSRPAPRTGADGRGAARADRKVRGRCLASGASRPRNPFMTRSLRRSAARAGVATATFAALAAALPAGAQAPAACAIDQNKPATLGKAFFTVQRVQANADTAAKFKALREAALSVANDANAAKQNPAGTALTLGQIQALLASDVGLVLNGTRGGAGLPGDAAAKVDVLAELDGHLKTVEAVSPACAGTAAQLRQMAWVGPMNAALQAFNGNKADEAEALAKRAAFIYQESPLPFFVLGNIAQTKNDMPTAEGHWTTIARVAEKDTAQQSQELRANALFNLAAVAASRADAATGDAQKQAAAQAAERGRAFLAAYPSHPDAARMQGTMARMLGYTGDKAALKSTYADMLANPQKYTDLQLTQGGVTASQAANEADATTLFSAALQQNPYQRDALNNLAATHMNAKRWEAMLPPARKLVEIDPGNPDAYLFVALAYQGMANATKVPATKKAYNDSIVTYSQKMEKLPYKVTYNEFTRGENRTVVGWAFEVPKAQAAAARPAARGAAAAAKPAAAAGGAKSYTMKVEFLDKTGAVVDTQTTTVGPVAPGESKAVKVESGKAAAAVRYTIAAA